MLAKYSRWSVRTLRDVGVQTGLPAAVAGPPAELDEQLAAVQLGVGLVQPLRRARTRRRRSEVSAHALDVDRRAGDEEDCRSVSCIGRTMLGRLPDAVERADPARRLPGAVNVTGAEVGVPERSCRPQELRRRFGEGEAAVDALAGVSVDFPSGRFAAIMGPSGSGKSTLHAPARGARSPDLGDRARSAASS